MVDPGNNSTGLSLWSVLAGFSPGVSVAPALAVRVSQRKACLRLVSVTTSWAPEVASWCRRDESLARVPA